MINILKDTWCINIGKYLVQLAPAYFCKSHFEQYNNYIGKFLRFKKDTPLRKLLDVLTVHDTKFTYQKSTDPNVYVKFATQVDLIEACKRTFYYDNMKINGILKDISWEDQKIWQQNASLNISLQNDISQNTRPATTGSNLIPVNKS